MKLNKILLATGALSWDGYERRSDRYGAVTFWDEDSNGDKIEGVSVTYNTDALKRLDGTKGCLYALIKDTRKSTHVGDFFRGFEPTTPEKGDRIILGRGKLFHNIHDGYIAIGLIPLDGRDKDWLEPQSLYRCHEQTVSLFFEYNSDD